MEDYEKLLILKDAKSKEIKVLGFYNCQDYRKACRIAKKHKEEGFCAVYDALWAEMDGGVEFVDITDEIKKLTF